MGVVKMYFVENVKWIYKLAQNVNQADLNIKGPLHYANGKNIIIIIIIRIIFL